MNVLTLIQRHPLLHADLKNLGLGSGALSALASSLTTQLGGDPGKNLCFVLSALNCQEFVRIVSAAEVAAEAGISPTLARTAVATIAPWVDRFEMQEIGINVK